MAAENCDIEIADLVEDVEEGGKEGIEQVIQDTDDVAFNGKEDKKVVVIDEGTQISTGFTDGSRKIDLIPVVEGSVGSSCGSQRSKLRLCVEMNIKSKLTGRDPYLDDEEPSVNADPVMVVVDYPNDVVVVVNAKIQKLERNPSLLSDDVDEVDRSGRVDNYGEELVQQRTEPVTDQAQSKLLDSTFVKVPLSSTLIYPILEESETSEICKGMDVKEPQGLEGARKSGSGDASFYHTVLGDNDGPFGNISAIEKMDIGENEKATQEPESSNVNFGKNPSAKLNSSFMLFKSEDITPGEKLVKALHVLARYRGVWGIYEDETQIMKHLTNLNRVLTTTDQATVKRACIEDDYLEMKGLIYYFSLEKRFEIRSELLQTFTLLSQKSEALAAFISASDVPVILAKEVGGGDYTSREMYAYASYLSHMITNVPLSDRQLDEIGDGFYNALCSLIVNSEKKLYKETSGILFEILLHYHSQLGESDTKWQSLFTVAENESVIKKIKQRLTSNFITIASLGPRSAWSKNEDTIKKVAEILLMIHDMIACSDTRELFADSELDVILITLIHNIEYVSCIEFHRTALKAIHRILVGIKTEPSGMEKLERITIKLLKESQESGGYDRSCRNILKKIYKIVSLSSPL